MKRQKLFSSWQFKISFSKTAPSLITSTIQYLKTLDCMGSPFIALQWKICLQFNLHISEFYCGCRRDKKRHDFKISKLGRLRSPQQNVYKIHFKINIATLNLSVWYMFYTRDLTTTQFQMGIKRNAQKTSFSSFAGFSNKQSSLVVGWSPP